MTKQELLDEIKSLVLSKGYTAVFFNHDQVVVNNTVVTRITFGDNTNALASLFNRTTYRTVAYSSLHRNRLTRMKKDIEEDNIVGYTDKDGKSVFKNGVIVPEYITQYVQTSDGRIHINTSDETWKQCVRCNCTIFNDSESLTLGGQTICADCIPITETYDCYKCGQKHFSWQLQSVCLTDTMKDYFKTDASRLRFCEECMDEEFNRCDICGKLELKNSSTECDCRSHRILYYSYKPRKAKLLSLKRPKKNTLFIGFENECELPGESSDACEDCEYCRGDDECEECDHYDSDENKSAYPEMLIKELGKIVYCKEDGSLENGFEIVTEPMTYGYILANQQKFKNAFKAIAHAGAFSYDSETTGFHIHLSRAAFKSRQHLLNFARIIYEDEDFSSAIAQRPGNSYCYYLSNNEMNDMKNIINSTIDGGDRYRAVNFCNSNTVEIRIYKGNLSFESCLTYIQHAVSVFHYTALATKLNKEVSVIDYINYVNKRGKIYKELKQKIEKIIKGGGKVKCA